MGHVVGFGKVCPEAAKVDAVRNFEQPTATSKVRSFLGHTDSSFPTIPPLQFR